MPEADAYRHFALQPIFTGERLAIGYEALYRAGWENEFRGDPDAATRIMIDNWLLYGFEDVKEGQFTFLNCTRETLVSGLLTLLPKGAVFEILETVEPDPEVLKACRSLKAMGYRISLDDFDDPGRMAAFLEIVDFIKIDFRQSDQERRAYLLKRLKGIGALLIAEKIETEEEFRWAKWEGFELFQGFYFSQMASFVTPRDSLSAIGCLPMLELLREPGFAIHKLADWVDQQPGISCRLLRRANWSAAKYHPINSTRDALKLIGKDAFRKLLYLAILTSASDWRQLPAEIGLEEMLTGRTDAAGREPDGKPDNKPDNKPTGEPRFQGAQTSRREDPTAGLGKVLKMSLTHLNARTLRQYR